MDMPFQLTCSSEFEVIGFQDGERVSSVIRTLSTLITISLVSSWCSRSNIGRLLIFFSHWMSGLVHQLAQLVLAEMVLLCWSKKSLLILIKALKFLELTATTMLAVTNVAICVILALIVSTDRTVSSLKSVASPAVMLSFLAGSVLITVAAVPFWGSIVMSGTSFWAFGDSPGGQDWVIVSSFFVEFIAALMMLAIMLALAVFRQQELSQVWKTHKRIKFYFALTLIAIVLNLSIGIAGLKYVSGGRNSADLTATWTMRHIHIALDTLVLYSALGSTRFDMESSSGAGGGRSSDEPSRNGHSSSGGGRKRPSMASSSRRKASGVSVQSVSRSYSPAV